MDQLQNTIEEAFERRAGITPRNVEAKLKESVAQVLEMLDSGKLRVAEKVNGEWKIINVLWELKPKPAEQPASAAKP